MVGSSAEELHAASRSRSDRSAGCDAVLDAVDAGALVGAAVWLPLQLDPRRAVTAKTADAATRAWRACAID
jgi:hypothetical protein